MRFLFYLEPHPIRSSFTAFRWISEDFIPALLAHDACWQQDSLSIYANTATLERFCSKFPALAQHAIYPMADEEALFQREFQDAWEQDGIPRWRMLLEGGALADQYEALLEAVHARAPFDAIIYWGTNQAIVDFGKKHHIPTLDMELGCTRAPQMDSMVMDPVGVNGNSIFTALSYEDLCAMPALVHAEALPGSAANAPRPFVDISPQTPTAFLPLQLYDDANLLRFAPYDSMLEFLQDVAPRIVAAGYRLIVKEHPATFSRETDKRRSQAIAEYLSQFPNHRWIPAQQPVDNQQLFAQASLVVTVNSSVGYEASLRGIPVVVMGQANYKFRNLLPTLDEALAADFDRTAYQQRLRVLHQFMGVAVLHSARHMRHAEYFIAVAKLTISAMRESAGNAVEFAAYLLANRHQLPDIAIMDSAEKPASFPQGVKRWLQKHPRLYAFALMIQRKLQH